MADINVVVTLGLQAELVERLNAVDPRLRVTTLTPAQRRLFRGGAPAWSGYKEAASDAEESEEQARGALHNKLAEAEVLFTLSLMPDDLPSLAPRLRWIQLTSAGADRLLNSAVLKSGVTITTASGIHAAPVGEYAVGMIVMLAKGWPALFRAQTRREWARITPQELDGKTVAVVGMGNVGQEIARLCKALNMRVLGVRRSGVPPESGDYIADEIVGPLELLPVLSRADFVVVCLPLTEETHHLIGELALRSMKPSAYLINVSRGAVVDEASLLKALTEGWIAGAGLDVFETEPLPEKSWLWHLNNVIITPHLAGETPVYNERAVDLFCENLRRYIAGEPLHNVVEPSRGY
jgi:phosphoglycerate dehydrogenase-like enzyme